MALRRILALLTMMLLLAGCYRQADDSFQTVDSQGGETPQSIDVTPTDVVPVIDPNAGSETPTPLSDVTTLTVPDASPTIVIIEVDASPTEAVVIIDPTTEVPEATNTPVEPVGAPTTLPTATPPTVITPVTGNPLLVVLPTSTPTPNVTQAAGSNGGLLPTPTDLGAPVPEECRYTIVSGDNLYRIALRHSVELADLLAENSLTESSIIQPGDSLLIPGCDPSAAAPVATSTTAAGIIQATPFPSGVTMHTVASGETLTTIARQYGVSLQSIIDANNLINPDRLAVGDELMIPAQP
jgi:LysM repeat protein